MNKQLAGLLALLVAFGGCEKQEEVTSTPAETPAGPVTARVLAECPQVGDDGQVAIYDGLEATILRNGYGRAVLAGDSVVVHAKLWMHDADAEDGKGEFIWDSGPGGFAFVIGEGDLIKGWHPGIACMLVGEKRELYIASELAYGERGRQGVPPNTDLFYELELLKVVEPES